MIQSQGIARKMICQKCERYRGPEGVLAVHCGCRGDRPCSNIVSLLRECPEKKWVGVAAPVPVVEAKPVAVDVHTAIRKARLGQAITAKEWDVLPQWMKNRSKRPAEAKYAPAPSPGSVFMLEDGEEVPGRHIRPKVGGSVFLLCGGPSLAKMNLELLRQPGIVTMGVNNSPAVFRPNWWVHVDAADRFLRSIWEDENIRKFTPIGLKNGRIFDSDSWSYTEQKVTDCPNVSYYRRHEGFAAGEFLRGNSVCWGGKEGKSVMLAAIRILYELGFRKIYLLGADFRMAEDYGYAWAQGRAAAAVANNNRLYGALNDWFTQLRPLFEQEGLQVKNCTPESGLKAFDAMTLEEAVAEARLKIDVAKERTEGLYDKAKPNFISSSVAMTWAKLEFPETRAVMTGCDERHAWILPWWYANLRRHNPDMPAIFVDKGMGDQTREWCRERGRVVTVTWKDHIMFAKPIGIIQSPYQETMWIDPDCEIRGNLVGAFDLPRSDLAACYDTVKFMGPGHIQAGVVLVKHGSDAAIQWASICAMGNACKEMVGDVKNVCDQAVLNWVATQNREVMTIIPRIWNWVRMDGNNPDAVIYHWTGKRGKDAIRHQLQEMVA